MWIKFYKVTSSLKLDLPFQSKSQWRSQLFLNILDTEELIGYGKLVQLGAVIRPAAGRAWFWLELQTGHLDAGKA